VGEDILGERVESFKELVVSERDERSAWMLRRRMLVVVREYAPAQALTADSLRSILRKRVLVAWRGIEREEMNRRP
jgi:hypothetical protein